MYIKYIENEITIQMANVNLKYYIDILNHLNKLWKKILQLNSDQTTKDLQC